MTIYVDQLKNNGWVLRGKPTKNCHLWSDKNTDELLAFGLKIGLKLEWLQKSRKGLIHFDLNPLKRRQAIAKGAEEKKL